MRRISTGTLARVAVGTLGGNSAATQVPSTAITESLAESRSAAAPAVFGTPLLTNHFVNLTMLTNAEACAGDPGGTRLNLGLTFSHDARASLTGTFLAALPELAT